MNPKERNDRKFWQIMGKISFFHIFGWFPFFGNSLGKLMFLAHACHRIIKGRYLVLVIFMVFLC